MSINPGATTIPRASMERRAGAFPRFPTAAILPPRMATSPAYHGDPVPSIIRPLRITRSYGLATAANHKTGSRIIREVYGSAAGLRAKCNRTAAHALKAQTVQLNNSDAAQFSQSMCRGVPDQVFVHTFIFVPVDVSRGGDRDPIDSRMSAL